MSARLAGVGYGYHPGSVEHGDAALLCLVAAIYSCGSPLNQKGLCISGNHFGSRHILDVVLLVCTSGNVPSVSTANLSGLRLVIAVCWILSIPIALIAQVIFVVNFVLSISKLRGVER